MNLQGPRVGETDRLWNNLHPHLESVIDWPGDRAERIVLVDFGNGNLGLFLFTASHERDPSVDAGRRGTACDCEYGSDPDRNTKMHVVRLTDDALGCKP
jgi:hypothetical protein